MRKELWLLVLIIVVGVALRLTVIPAFSSTYKPVDVYYVDSQAANMTLNLQNPYTSTFHVHNYTWAFFAYLPMISIYYVPFYVLGDIRYGNIFADVLIMLALFWIGKSFNRGIAIWAPLTFAILPWAIWLTSIAATNIMIGTAFLMLALASLLRKKFVTAAIFLGLAVASNQLVALLLPLFGFYYWKQRKLSQFTVSLAVCAARILPYFVSAPSNFFAAVFELQFVRYLQPVGPFSLYSVLSLNFGIQLNSLIRVAIFSLPFALITFAPKKRSTTVVISVGAVLFLAAFVLPVNGFWNYFLPSITISCAFIPYLTDILDRKLQEIKWLPYYHWLDYLKPKKTE